MEMIKTTSMIEESLISKIDDDFVEEALQGVPTSPVGFIFICQNNDWHKNETWTHKGRKIYQIVLPYEKVVNMEADDVRQWMLQLAEERLGLVRETQR